MTALIHSVLSATVPMVLLGVGLLAIAGIVVWHARRTNRIVELADELLNLAMDGRADEARIRARRSGRAVRSVLNVLGGDVEPPHRRGMLEDTPWVLLVALPVLTFVTYSLLTLGGEGETRIQAATALLFGTSLLLPAAFAASISIFEISRRATRAVRGTCISLLAQNVKAAVDVERKEAIRRGPQKDPRGE